jgi:hypothetical protein
MLSSIERAGSAAKARSLLAPASRSRGRKAPVSMRQHYGNLDLAAGAHHLQRYVVAVSTNAKIDA